MNTVEWIGALAAALTTLCFVPQALKLLATREISGISSGMYALMILGLVLWLIYGVATRQWNIVVPDGIALALCLAILRMKRHEEKHRGSS